jgi:hypothetical protein
LFFYVVKNGKRTAVVLPLYANEELLQDLDDLRVIALRKNEPTIPWRKLNANHLAI